MADKVQVKWKYSSDNYDEDNGFVSTTKTITMGKMSVTDDNIRTFCAALGSLTSGYTLTSIARIETTALDGDIETAISD